MIRYYIVIQRCDYKRGIHRIRTQMARVGHVARSQTLCVATPEYQRITKREKDQREPGTGYAVLEIAVPNAQAPDPTPTSRDTWKRVEDTDVDVWRPFAAWADRAAKRKLCSQRKRARRKQRRALRRQARAARRARFREVDVRSC